MSIVKFDSDRNQVNNILAYTNIPIIQQVVTSGGGGSYYCGIYNK